MPAYGLLLPRTMNRYEISREWFFPELPPKFLYREPNRVGTPTCFPASNLHSKDIDETTTAGAFSTHSNVDLFDDSGPWPRERGWRCLRG